MNERNGKKENLIPWYWGSFHSAQQWRGTQQQRSNKAGNMRWWLKSQFKCKPRHLMHECSLIHRAMQPSPSLNKYYIIYLNKLKKEKQQIISPRAWMDGWAWRSEILISWSGRVPKNNHRERKKETFFFITASSPVCFSKQISPAIWGRSGGWEHNLRRCVY